MSAHDISIDEARRIALAAQGLDRPRPNKATLRHVRAVIQRLGLIQLDYVNVLVPAHYQVLFSRLGNYDRAKFDELIYERKEFTEQWAHEACIVPMTSWALLRHRRETFEPWPNSAIMRLKGRNKYLSEVIEIIKERGACTSRDLPHVPGPKRRPGDWHRSLPRSALEYHFGSGVLAEVRRWEA